jgi:hypothetical protein
MPIVFIAAYVFVAISITLDYKKMGMQHLIGISVMAVFTALYFLLAQLKKINHRAELKFQLWIISYIINELAEDRENYFNAIAPPIIQSSNFAFKTVDDMRKALADEYSTYLYSRGRNPTVDILRKKLAALDHAEDCLVFNSGAAAIFAAVLANVKSGDHIVSVRKPYTWAQKNVQRNIAAFWGYLLLILMGGILKILSGPFYPTLPLSTWKALIAGIMRYRT